MLALTTSTFGVHLRTSSLEIRKAGDPSPARRFALSINCTTSYITPTQFNCPVSYSLTSLEVIPAVLRVTACESVLGYLSRCVPYVSRIPNDAIVRGSKK